MLICTTIKWNPFHVRCEPLGSSKIPVLRRDTPPTTLELGETCIPVNTSHVRALTLEVLGFVWVLRNAECVNPQVRDIEGASNSYGVLNCLRKELEGNVLRMSGEIEGVVVRVWAVPQQ
jgi:hypothetical protein